jgi:hypothetical protein
MSAIVYGLYMIGAVIAGISVTRAFLGKSWHFLAFLGLLYMQAATFAAVI